MCALELKLNHVALCVGNREISAAFYGKWFNLTTRLHDDDHLLILSDEAGNLLALSEEGEVPRDLPRTNHFGFQAKNPDDVRKMRVLAQKANIEEAEWQENGPTRLQLYDPDNYRVEIYSF